MRGTRVLKHGLKSAFLIFITRPFVATWFSEATSWTVWHILVNLDCIGDIPDLAQVLRDHWETSKIDTCYAHPSLLPRNISF